GIIIPVFIDIVCVVIIVTGRVMESAYARSILVIIVIVLVEFLLILRSFLYPRAILVSVVLVLSLILAGRGGRRGSFFIFGRIINIIILGKAKRSNCCKGYGK